MSKIGGYIVLTEDADGSVRDDWDGEVHPTIKAGALALKECAEAGWTCCLVECHIVSSRTGQRQG